MRVTDAEGVALLRDLFGLKPSVDFSEVKKAYRDRSRETHPDRGGFEDEFKALSVGFTKLRKLNQQGSNLFSVGSGVEQLPTTTVDGKRLIDLGLGLGPTTNGIDCTDCDCKGYTLYREREHPRCSPCHGSGMRGKRVPCRSCSGSGRFVQKHSGREVDCRTCNGTGQFELRHRYEGICYTCLGTGVGTGEVQVHVRALVCRACNGAGEKAIFNPVLPKGRLVAGR